MSIRYCGSNSVGRGIGVKSGGPVGPIYVNVVDVVPLGSDVARWVFDKTFLAARDNFELAGLLVGGGPLGTIGGGQPGDNYIDLEYASVDAGDTWEVDYQMDMGGRRRILDAQTGTIVGGSAVSSLTELTAEFPADSGLLGGDTYLIPASMPHPTHMFACGSPSGRLYRMQEGDTAWTRTGSATATGLTGYIWSFANGNIIMMSGAVGSIKLWYSDDLGESFTEVIGSGSIGPVEFSATGYPNDWSFAEGPSGKALLVEYGSINGDNKVGPRIFWTDDNGFTWSIVLDTTSLPAADQWNHVHAVHWHAATSKFVIGVGDSTRARVFTLDEDGANLTNVLDRPMAAQPVWFVDGVGNEVLFGDDTHAQLAALNVATGAVRQVFKGWRGVLSTFDWCWHIAKYNGVYYAFQCQSTQYSWARREIVLLVAPSPDGPWTVAWVFGPTLITGSSFAGYMNGLLHFKIKSISDLGKHWVVNPVNLRVRGSAAANGSRTNTEQADAVTSIGAKWYAYNNTSFTVETGAGIAGTNCLKYVGNGGGGVPQVLRIAVGSTGAVTAGKVYQASAWVKVTSSRHLQIQVGYTLGTGSNVGTKHFQYCPSGVWTFVKSMAFLVPAGVTNASIQFQLNAEDNVASDPPTFYIDRVMVTEAPSPEEWIAASATLAETAHSGTLPARARWTDIFWFEPIESHHRLVGHLSFCDVPHCIRSWKVGIAIIELWMHAGVKGQLSGSQTTTITASAGIFRADMEGEILHAGKLDNTAGSTTQIVSYLGPTQVTVEDSLAARLTGENVSVEAPRFELRINDGTQSESIYSPRIAWLRGCGIGFAVQAGGEADDKIRAYAMFGGTLHAFEVSGNEYPAYLDVEIDTHFGASSLTADRVHTAAVGKFIHLGNFGYVPEADLEDVILDGEYDEPQPDPEVDGGVYTWEPYCTAAAPTIVAWTWRTNHVEPAVSATFPDHGAEPASYFAGLQVMNDSGTWVSPISVELAYFDTFQLDYGFDTSGKPFRTTVLAESIEHDPVELFIGRRQTGFVVLI